MKINFAQILKNIDGSDLQIGPDTPALTLASVVQGALLTPQDEDRHATGEAKVKLYQLALGLSPAELDYPVEDLALMKKRVAPMYGPIVVGQAWQMLDGAD